MNLYWINHKILNLIFSNMKGYRIIVQILKKILTNKVHRFNMDYRTEFFNFLSNFWL